MRARRHLLPFIKFVLAIIAYWLASWILPSSLPAVDWWDVLLATLLPGLVFWIQDQIRHGDENASESWLLLVDNFLVGTGLNLILQAMLSYVLVATPISGMAAVLGSLLAAAGFAALVQAVLPRKRYLLLGIDQGTATLAAALPPRQIVGLVAEGPQSAPPGIKYLGGLSELQQVIHEHRPDTAILSGHLAAPARDLLDIKWEGIDCVDAAALYERYLNRVCASCVQARDVYLADSLFPFRPAMAIQAIYNNLIGLALLILFFPVLALFALLTLVFSGPGPILERTACIGFYRIPFRRLRFRLHNRRTGRLTAIGRTIRALHLTRLPELINVVRGELAFIGPAAVRAEHATRLMQLIPLYFQRFSVKPGLLSWGGAEGSRKRELRPEVEQLEFDLYYIKNISFSLDLETMSRWALGMLSPPLAAPAARTQE